MRPLTTLPAALLALLTTTAASPSPDEFQIDTTHPVTCTRPTRPGDKISVHYRGTLQSDGTEFDASYNRHKPFAFTLGAGQVIKGWDEGLKEMCPGERRVLTIPSEMGYGEFGSPPVIPGGATLVFETVLVEIVGVDAGVVSEEAKTVVLSSSATEEGGGGFTIATAPSEPTATQLGAENEDKVEPTPALEATPLRPSSTSSPPQEEQEGECHLLGPFALLVQGALGLMAILSLVYKRWREEPKRPWKIWFFDVSKQVFGSVLTHILNLGMSMLGAADIEHAPQAAASKTAGEDSAAANADGGAGRSHPNPCSYYLLNLLIDTTIGIAVLYLLLKVLHAAFSYTAVARPKESIKSGHYGHPPHVTWWLKQLGIYFLGLVGMKLFVLLLFALLPWLPWVGDWMLRWTEGNEALEIAFSMFIFPLAMNAVQYWIIDNFIMAKTKSDGGKGGGGDEGGEYQRVLERGEDGESDDEDDNTVVPVGEEDGDGRKDRGE